MMNRRRNQRGFSMMELLIALAIIALLAAVAGPLLYKRLAKAKSTVATEQIRGLMEATEAFRIDHGHPPAKLEELVSPSGKDADWYGPYMERIPADPWSREYLYQPNQGTRGYEIKSLGKDGKEGGQEEDRDISSSKL